MPELLRLWTGGAHFVWFCATWIKQSKGRWAGEPLVLYPAQMNIVGEMLKTRQTDWLEISDDDPHLWEKLREFSHDGIASGGRVYREAYIQTPKKQGKSTLSSALALYLLLADGEQGAEIYSVAAASDQAKIVFRQAREMAESSPRILDHAKVYADGVFVPSSNSVYRVLGGDADYDEGFNPHGVIVDELHVHKDRKLYDAMTSHLNTGVREDPIAVAITNAGEDTETTICGEVYQQARAVLEGRPDARTDLYAYVPELAEAEYDNPDAWMRVNPAPWTTVEDLENDRRKMPRFVFLRRRLNVWTAGEDAWLDYEFWEECEDEELAIPHRHPICLGIDLGLKHDTAAVAWAADVQGRIVGRAHVWGLHRQPEKAPPPCHEVIRDVRLPISLVRNYVTEVLAKRYSVTELAYDPYRFEESAQELDEMGFEVVEFPQTDARMIPASQALFDAIVSDGVFRHDGDPVLTAHVMAGKASETGRGWRLAKRKSTRPVDALIALAMAVDRLRANRDEGASQPAITVLA